SFAVTLALPTVAVIIAIIALAIPHLTFENLQPLHGSASHIWVSFVGVILALSGVEAIANLTGTLKSDKNSPIGHPRVGKTSAKAIIPVALEVSLGTLLLGWAMLSLSPSLAPQMVERKEDMLRFAAEQYATMAFGPMIGQGFGLVVGVVFALLLLSAVNTAVAAQLGLLFMMSREGDMPKSFSKLNSSGVPVAPLAISIALPILILLMTDNFDSLAGLYAIGVVGAIAINLGSSATNLKLEMAIPERALMVVTALILVAVEFTLAYTKHDALFFVVCVLIVGLSLWAYSRRLSGITTLTVSSEVAKIVKPEIIENLRARVDSGVEFRARRGRAAQGGSVCPVCPRDRRALSRRELEGPRFLEGRPRGQRHSLRRRANRKRPEHPNDPAFRNGHRGRLTHCGHRRDDWCGFPDPRRFAPRLSGEGAQGKCRHASRSEPAGQYPARHPRLTVAASRRIGRSCSR
ncbi:MAG: hypothetical protein CAK85_00515, partial [Spartobacteria bacterium AMD-G5]